MAIDTAEKRRSVSGAPFLPLTPGVTPDASPGAAWRASVAWGYSGIGVAAPSPPGVYTVEVDKDDNGSFEEDVTSVTRAQPGVKIVIGADARQKLIPSRVSSATYEIGFPVIADVDRGDPTRVQGAFSGTTYGMFKGRIASTAVDPNVTRQVTIVKALGPLAQAANRKGLSTQVYFAISIDTAIGHILTELGITGGERVLDAATRGDLDIWWLDSESNVWAELQKLVRLEGPNARLYEDPDGVVQFEAEDFRTTATRSTVLQETFRGGAGGDAEPIYSKMAPVLDDDKRIINNVKLRQSIRAANNDDIVRVSFTEQSVSSGTEFTINKPDGVIDEDVLIAWLHFFDTPGDPGAITVPDGWAVINTTGAQTGGIQGTSYWKRADGEGDDFTWSWQNSSSGRMVMVAYRNCIEIGTPLEDSQADSNLDNTSEPTSTAITPLGANRRIISLLSTTVFSASWTPPTDFTTINNLGGAFVADFTQPAAGSGGALQWTHTSGEPSTIDNSLQTLALVPKASVVWKAGGDLTFGNDEAFEIVARASNPFENAIVPVEGTDWEFGAGSLAVGLSLDRPSGQTVTISGTAGAGGVTFEGPADDTEGGMRLRADALPVTVTNEVTAVSGDELKALPGYSVWPHTSVANMQSLADDIITYAASTKQILSITIEADRSATTLTSCLERLPSDRIRIITTRTAIDVTGFVEEIRHQIGRKQRLTTTLTIREV
jgi:hypothetical protein